MTRGNSKVHGWRTVVDQILLGGGGDCGVTIKRQTQPELSISKVDIMGTQVGLHMWTGFCEDVPALGEETSNIRTVDLAVEVE